jgi:hypothetical protein
MHLATISMPWIAQTLLSDLPEEQQVESGITTQGTGINEEITFL